MPTAILKCKCAHQFQDSTYGEGKRVFNHTLASKDKDKVVLRCTVCASTKEVRKSEIDGSK